MTVGASTQITALTVNDHACLTYGEAEELLDLTAAFVRDGLSGGLKVLWLSDAAPGQAAPELARRGIATGPAIAAGQTTTAAYEGRLLSGHVFAAEHAMGWLTWICVTAEPVNAGSCPWAAGGPGDTMTGSWVSPSGRHATNTLRLLAEGAAVAAGLPARRC